MNPSESTDAIQVIHQMLASTPENRRVRGLMHDARELAREASQFAERRLQQLESHPEMHEISTATLRRIITQLTRVANEIEPIEDDENEGSEPNS